MRLRFSKSNSGRRNAGLWKQQRQGSHVASQEGIPNVITVPVTATTAKPCPDGDFPSIIDASKFDEDISVLAEPLGERDLASAFELSVERLCSTIDTAVSRACSTVDTAVSRVCSTIEYAVANLCSAANLATFYLAALVVFLFQAVHGNGISPIEMYLLLLVFAFVYWIERPWKDKT